MQQDYRKKYLKYKSKYLELKNQVGGDNFILNNHNCTTSIAGTKKIGKTIVKNNTTATANCFTIKELQPIFNHLDGFELEQKSNIYKLYGIKKIKEKEIREFIADTSNKTFKYNKKDIKCSKTQSSDGYIHIMITVYINNIKEIQFTIYFDEDKISTIYSDRFIPTIAKPKPDSHYSTVGLAVPKTTTTTTPTPPELPKPRSSSSSLSSEYERPVVPNPDKSIPEDPDYEDLDTIHLRLSRQDSGLSTENTRRARDTGYITVNDTPDGQTYENVPE